MSKIVHRLAAPEDAEEILKMRICKADLQELVASTGKPPKLVLVESIEHTPELWLVTKDGRIVAMYGIVETPLAGVGAPWFISTEDTSPMDFLKELGEILQKAHEDYSTLLVVVSSRHEASMGVLTELGFDRLPDILTLQDPAVPFYQFVRRSTSCAAL